MFTDFDQEVQSDCKNKNILDGCGIINTEKYLKYLPKKSQELIYLKFLYKS